MTHEVAEVRLWGRTIGAVSLAHGDRAAAFEFDPDFVESGIEVAPLTMPLARTIYRFPQLDGSTFQGLPGMLADALPDRFGNALIDQWLARQGRSASTFSAVERLCYTGSRGMGALEFAPAIGPDDHHKGSLRVDQLVQLASAILAERQSLEVKLSGDDGNQALADILRVGTSAGGARAKAVIAWNRQTNEVRSGQTSLAKDFEHWLLKFDGVSGNRDKELNDPQGFGLIELAYAKMATACGIEMSECRILEENGRHHFMTRRFDRTEDGKKLHLQSLCAIAHLDFNMSGGHSYEQAFQVIRKLDLGMPTLEQQYLRMVFNVVARNQDDHTKNIGFLMDKRGQWRLSPAYDVTYNYNPQGEWTSRHQMTLNGKREDFLASDFQAVAQNASLKRGFDKLGLTRVIDVVRRWRDFADAAGVPEEMAAQIGENHRLVFG